MRIIKDKITQLEVYFYTNFNSKRPMNLNHVTVVFLTHSVVGLSIAIHKYDILGRTNCPQGLFTCT